MQNNGKAAAIWCRVSPHDQRELSLESQEASVRRVLESLGYDTPPQYVLKVDWTSMDLMACPSFQQLRQWIATGQVHAIGVLDRDRLQAQGLQRLIFLSECQEHDTKVVTVQGVPMLEGAEGQLVELALALGKERSVMRAQQGARDGLRARAVMKGLPPSMRPPYGMWWEDNKLVPSNDYSVVCDIWRMALEGRALWGIAKELTQQGTPTPRGKRVWAGSTIRAILKNSTYTGVIEACKTEAVTPEKRLKRTYGKTTSRIRPAPERIVLRGLVTQPVLSDEEFQWVQQRLRDNQRFAFKNTRLRHYQLRGLIRCSLCGQLYTGVTRRGRSDYYCRGRWGVPWGTEKWSADKLPANVVENHVWNMGVSFLRGSEGFLTEMRRRMGIKEQSAESIRRELANLKRQDSEEQDAETRAFRLASHGKVSDEVFDQEVGLIRTRRRWIAEQRDRLGAQLADLERYSLSPELIGSLRQRLEGHLTGATLQDRRFVLEAVGAEVVAQGNGAWELELEVPRDLEHVGQIVNTEPWIPLASHLHLRGGGISGSY